MDLSSHGVFFCIAIRASFGSTFMSIMTHMSHDTQQRKSLDLLKKCSSIKCIFTLSSEPFFCCFASHVQILYVCRSRFDDDGSGPSSSVGAFQAASAALSSSGHRGMDNY